MISSQSPATSSWPANPAPADAGGHVFLSYRSDDAEFALLLAATLRRAGLRLWMDRLSILPGGGLAQRLAGGLAQRRRHHPGDHARLRRIAATASANCRAPTASAARLSRCCWRKSMRRSGRWRWSARSSSISGDWRSPNSFRRNAEKLAAVLRTHFAGRISFEPDETECALTDLAVDLYTRRGMQEYLEQVSEADRVVGHGLVRPEPPGIRAWMEHASFIVIDHTPALGEVSPLAGRRSQPRPLAQIRESHPRCVLVGEPGSGKTSALHNLVLNDIHNWQLMRTGRAAAAHQPGRLGRPDVAAGFDSGALETARRSTAPAGARGDHALSGRVERNWRPPPPQGRFAA